MKHYCKWQEVAERITGSELSSLKSDCGPLIIFSFQRCLKVKMLGRIFRIFVVLNSVFVFTGCCRKKEARLGSSYYIYPNDTLPSDLQVTTWLEKGETKRFFYTSYMDSGALSLTVSTCTSSIWWSFSTNNSTRSTIITHSSSTIPFSPSKNIFSLYLLAPDQDTFVHIYLSTEHGGPQALQSAKFAKIKLLKRQKGKRLTVKWNPSMVDPQFTDYCLVISTMIIKGTLCSAELTKSNGTSVVCVGRKTHYTINYLKHGQKYYFGIFAINHQSNFTYPYGTTSTLYDGRFRHTSLKDGKSSFANLKKLDGKAVFRYKVSDSYTKSLDLFIIPCGGVIDVEVTLKDVTVIQPKRIESFGRITIENPLPSARYYIKIFALNKEELKKTSGVEIYATTRYPTKIPLPSMPEVVKITEYNSMTTCNSVTVGWMAVKSQKNVNYCLSAKEGRIREMEEYRMPNQCGLENRLKKSTDFAIKYCLQLKYDNESVIVQTLNQLKPARFYIIQVTVKKPKGKTLSYDLLQIRTKPSCKKKN